MKIVLDTNVLVGSVSPLSPHHWLYQAVNDGQLCLVVTTEIIAEYEEILGNYYSSKMAEWAVKGILSNPHTIFVRQVHFKWNMITADPDDNKFVDCAIAANADYIVTQDKHFSETRGKFPPVRYTGMEDFKNLYYSNPGI